MKDADKDMNEVNNQDSVLSGLDLKKKAEEIGVGYLSKAPRDIDRGVLKIFTQDVAGKYQMVAFEKSGKYLRVAMIDPQNVDALNALRFIAKKENLETEIYLVSRKVFEDIFDFYDVAEEMVGDVVESLGQDDFDGFNIRGEEKDDPEFIKDAPVAKLVKVILDHAVDGKASDIHIEPYLNNYRVRFRVDGVLHASLEFPKQVGHAVVSRIKVLANLKIDERRKPQDGRFKIENDGKKIDLRVSTLPVVEGEKVVMRVLSKDDMKLDLKSLGLVGKNHDILSKKLKETFGIILITGPTGSGKSTTLYAFLKILNQEQRNIITLEDPVEYFVEGINQSQIKPEIGYTFANGLRSILRQDPNVIMVGEIRDTETAELAIHAALTGHLVFSTLHTNDAVGAIPRLIDMGIEPFLLSSSVRAVIAQRLVRKICEECKEEVEIPQAITEAVKKEISGVSRENLGKYELDLSAGYKFYRGRGCDACSGVGLKGRLAIYEVIDVDEKLQSIISQEHGSPEKIADYAKKQGAITMKQDGLIKVLLGQTTLSEVERVTEVGADIGGDVDDDKG